MINAAAVVPVFNPEPGLNALCRELAANFSLVVVVDDGSKIDLNLFDELPRSVVLLHHSINQGKGSAIKTALRWLQENHPNVDLAVFADGDGQHRVEDVCRVALHGQSTGHVTLGVRDFGKMGIPFRSRFGNVLTSFLVRLFFRVRIFDTQTGLRALPMRLFADFLSLSGQRYEFEMQLFGLLKRLSEPLEQVPIETIYIDNNRASHFRPIVDSIRVYRGLFGDLWLKFIASSILGFLVDNILFTAVIWAGARVGLERRYDILLALVISRLISATVNYPCNRNWVFQSQVRVSRSMARYWFLVGLIAGLSYLGTAIASAICDAQGIAISVVKIVVDISLFILSYFMQRVWVFK